MPTTTLSKAGHGRSGMEFTVRPIRHGGCFGYGVEVAPVPLDYGGNWGSLKAVWVVLGHRFGRLELVRRRGHVVLRVA